MIRPRILSAAAETVSKRVAVAITRNNAAIGNATTTKQHSGLQKSIFALYRTVLRTALAKDQQVLSSSSSSSSSSTITSEQRRIPFWELLLNKHSLSVQSASTTNYNASSSLSSDSSVSITTRTNTSYAAYEFRKQSKSVERSNYQQIEYMMRKCQKQLKLLQMPGVQHISGAK
jgi:hypothetical protein